MRYIELFAGIGGMGYGLMQAGMECVGYVEWDKYAHKAFQLLHDPEERMWNAYDVRDVTDEHIRLLGTERGPIDLIAGGFPCQAFSIAGKRQGFKDSTRGTLFFEIVRFASILRPRYLLLENVTGLLNHDDGRTFETVIRTLDELGYVGEWCVLNSAAYVPQNRERVFIVASLGGDGGRKIFPFGGQNSNAVEVVGRVDINADDYCKRVYSPAGLSPCLPTMQGGSQEPKIILADNGPQHKVQQIKNNIAPTLRVGGGGDKPGIWVTEPVAVLTPDREEKHQNGRRFKEPGEPMLTLTAQDKHGVAISQLNPGARQGERIYDADGLSPTICANVTGGFKPIMHVTNDYRIRKLTPLECFRLQSFPDEWYYKLKEAGISDSQLYKMAGNAVTSVVAYEIGRRLVG